MLGLIQYSSISWITKFNFQLNPMDYTSHQWILHVWSFFLLLCTWCHRRCIIAFHSGLPGCTSAVVESWMVFFFRIPRSWTFSKNVLCANNTFTVSTSFFCSSMSRLSLARRFWNHVITCKLNSRVNALPNWFSKKKESTGDWNLLGHSIVLTKRQSHHDPPAIDIFDK